MNRAFTNSNRNQMGSSVKTNYFQGGGDKKAGFPYIVGRGYMSSIFFQSIDPVHGHCCKLNDLQTVRFPLATISRPIGTLTGNAGYWHIKNT
jgi:hypothetical protein